MEDTITEINDINGEVNGILGSKFLYDNNFIQSLILPNVQRMKDSAVAYCDNLRYVMMPSCTGVPYRGFRECPKLEEAYFDKCKEIGAEAFQGCSKLSNVRFSTLVNPVAGNLFDGCGFINITAEMFPVLDTMTNDMFANCSKLESVSLPEVTTIQSGVFSGCTALSSVTLPKLTTIRGGSVFNNSPLIPKFFENIPTITGDYCFSGSYFEELHFTNITSLSYRLFKNANKIKSVTVDKVTSINSEVFQYASLFEKLVIKTPTLCTLSSANSFDGTKIASGNGYIYVPDTLVEDYKAATNWSTYAAQIKGLSELPSE